MEIPPDFQMKAGRGDGAMPPDPEVVLAMTSVLCVFLEAAMRDAAAYAEAAGRRCVADRDVSMAMKAQAVPSNAFWDRPDMAAEFGAHRAGLLEDMARESDEEEEEGELAAQADGEAERWTRAPSGVAIADRLHAAESEFAHWAPTEPLEMAVRNAIVRAASEGEEARDEPAE